MSTDANGNEHGRDTGRFEPKLTSESGDTLTSWRVGTYRYPEVIRSNAEDVVAYYDSLDVPDEVLEDFEDRIEKVQKKRVQDDVQEWERANPKPARREEAEQWSRARQQVVNESWGRHPQPNAEDVRPLARIKRAVDLAGPALPPSEGERYHAMVFTLPATLEKGTAMDLLRHYGADRIDSDKLGRRRKQKDQSDEILDALNKLVVYSRPSHDE